MRGLSEQTPGRGVRRTLQVGLISSRKMRRAHTRRNRVNLLDMQTVVLRIEGDEFLQGSRAEDGVTRLSGPLGGRQAIEHFQRPEPRGREIAQRFDAVLFEVVAFDRPHVGHLRGDERFVLVEDELDARQVHFAFHKTKIYIQR